MLFSLWPKLLKSIPERLQDARLVGRSRFYVGAVLGCVIAAGAAHAETLRAGFAQIDVSTRAQIPMGGYGTFFLKTPRLNTAGIHDPLFVGALVLESPEGELAALASVDAVGFSGVQVSRIEAKIREALNPKIHFILSATHTHHSPDTLGLWGSLPRSGRNVRYSEQLEAAIVQAVQEAFAARVPVKVTQKVGRHANDSTAAEAWAPEDLQDQFISLSFYSEALGALVGTFTQWSAHPTVLGMENNALSADYVGAFREAMSRRWAVPHLYFNGAIGKVNPLVPAADDPELSDDLFPAGDKDPDVKDHYRRVSTVGDRLAQSVLNTEEQRLALNYSKFGSFSMCHVPVAFPVDNFLFKTASQLRVVETRIKSGKIRSRVSSLGVGPLVFVSIPGELFPKVLKKIPPQALTGRKPIWLGMGQDWLGYFVDQADYQNPKLKYWTDLSVHKEASNLLLEGMSKAVSGQGCVEWTDED